MNVTGNSIDHELVDSFKKYEDKLLVQRTKIACLLAIVLLTVSGGMDFFVA